MSGKNEFGQIIRNERHRLEFTQQQLGEKVGVSDSYIAHIEGGLKTPSLDIAMALSEVFGYTLPQQRALLDALDASRVRRSERRIRVRGRAIRHALRSLEQGGPGGIVVQDPEGDATAITIPTAGRRPERLVFSADGRRIAGVDTDGVTTVWDIEREERVRSIERTGAGAVDVALSSTGDTLVTADDQGFLVRWDVGTGRPEADLELTGSTLTAIALSPDDARIGAGDESGRAMLWLVGEAAPEWRADPQQGAISRLLFSPDGSMLAAGDDAGGIRLWRTESGAAAHEMEQRSGVSALAFSSDGALLASGDGQGDVVLWDAGSGHVLRTLESGGGLTDLAFAADGVTLVGLDEGGTVTAWDTRTGKARRSFEVDISRYSTCALSRDGSRVAGFDAAGAAVDEFDAEHIARDLASDRQLLDAWRDLRTALGRPETRDAVLTTLRALARSAG